MCVDEAIVGSFVVLRTLRTLSAPEGASVLFTFDGTFTMTRGTTAQSQTAVVALIREPATDLIVAFEPMAFFLRNEPNE